MEEKRRATCVSRQWECRDEELARLRKEPAIVKEEREILRKAAAIFSKPKR